jgi:hypothetical protein
MIAYVYAIYSIYVSLAHQTVAYKLQIQLSFIKE